jgi:hypothetical protein
MTRRDEAWFHRPDDYDSVNVDLRAVSEYRGELKEGKTAHRLNWFNILSFLVLMACFIACLHEAGCLGGK